MRKTILAILIFALYISLNTTVLADTIETTDKQYELWTQSPSITTGITDDEMRIYKSLDMNMLKLYPLSDIGDNYYFASCESQTTTGGSTGNKKLSDYYYYTLMTTDDRIIVLSEGYTYNSYYWDRENSMCTLSGKIDKDRYSSLGYESPIMILNPQGKYTNSNYDEWMEFIFVTDGAKVYMLNDCDDDGPTRYPVIKDGRLYFACEQYKSGKNIYNYYLEDGTTSATNLQEVGFKNETISIIGSHKVATSEITEANGYQIYKEGFTSDINFPAYYPVPGSDNLYYNYTSSAVYKGSGYVVCNDITVYKLIGDKMTKINNKVTEYSGAYAVTASSVKNISGIEDAKYTSKGYSTPAVLIGKSVITKDGNIYAVNLDSNEYSDFYFATYNGVLAIYRNKNSSGYFRYTAPDLGYTTAQYWYKVNEIYFDEYGNTLLGTTEEYVCGFAPDGLNGYFTSYKATSACTDLTEASIVTVRDWWPHYLTNVFPDGRYVICEWMSTGTYDCEIWYNIYSPDGIKIANGPTGYCSASSGTASYDIISYAVNNTKFILGIKNVQKSFLREYFRVSAVSENSSGEVIGAGVLGEKSLSNIEEADTEPVQPVIDFAKDELPIGYNIKDGVINSDKLDTNLNEQINAIRLKDIVINASGGYASGSINTGTSLEYISNYNYSMGSAYVRFYTNGQNLNWYCNDTEALNDGVYNISYPSGDKTLYFTVKIISPPSSDGVTTVVF